MKKKNFEYNGLNFRFIENVNGGQQWEYSEKIGEERINGFVVVYNKNPSNSDIYEAAMGNEDKSE